MTAFTGYRFQKLMKRVGIREDAGFVVTHCTGDYTTSLSLEMYK